jgi:hypothetical protein
MPYKQITGIYLIKNIVNNKLYIGSSINVMRRLSDHKNRLLKNKHYNIHLQASFNKYKIDNFIFQLHETCLIENLLERENYWIKYFNTTNNKLGYNKRAEASSNYGNKVSIETRIKLSLAHMGHKRSPETHTKIIAKQYKKVCQIDQNSNCIQQFKSLQEAEFVTKIAWQGISGVCRKINKSAGGYFWCFEQDYHNFKPPIDLRKK